MITPSPSYGQQRQLQVYTAGLQGQRPSLPVAPEDLEQTAIQHMSHEASGYLDGMADSMRANREAFRHWRIVPRMLRDVSPEFNASVVRRAEVAGCSAVVVTLDTFLLAWRERDIQNAYLPFLLGQGLGNYFSDPAIQHFLAIFNVWCEIERT